MHISSIFFWVVGGSREAIIRRESFCGISPCLVRRGFPGGSECVTMRCLIRYAPNLVRGYQFIVFLRDICLTSWAIAGPAPSGTRRPPNVAVRYRICSSYCRILPNPAREHRLTPPSYMRSQVKCFVEAIASDHAIRWRLRRPQALATACHHKSIFLTINRVNTISSDLSMRPKQHEPGLPTTILPLPFHCTRGWSAPRPRSASPAHTS